MGTRELEKVLSDLQVRETTERNEQAVPTQHAACFFDA